VDGPTKHCRGGESLVCLISGSDTEGGHGDRRADGTLASLGWEGWQAVAGGDRRDADQALAAALAAGSTKQEAARAELVSRAVGSLADASAAAVTTLRALLEADSESVRLGACRAILDLGLRLREAEELERRIAALEERAAAEQGWRKAG